jgi:hypothetical protein
VQLTAQAVAADRTLVNLAADHDPAAPGTGGWATGRGRGRCRPRQRLRPHQARIVRHPTQHHGTAMQALAASVEGIKNALPLQPMALRQSQGAQTARRARPRRRRDLITRRPVWLRMRTRKPETRLRFRLVPSRVRLVIGVSAVSASRSSYRQR